MKQFLKDMHSDGNMASWSRVTGSYMFLVGTGLIICGIIKHETEYVTQGVLLLITASGLKTVNSGFTERR